MQPVVEWLTSCATFQVHHLLREDFNHQRLSKPSPSHDTLHVDVIPNQKNTCLLLWLHIDSMHHAFLEPPGWSCCLLFVHSPPLSAEFWPCQPCTQTAQKTAAVPCNAWDEPLKLEPWQLGGTHSWWDVCPLFFFTVGMEEITRWTQS